MLCRLHLDAIRLYLESVDIGFGIASCFAPFFTSGSPEIMLLVIYRLKLG